MSKSIKLNNDLYLDSSGIVHNKTTLKELLELNAITVGLSANTTFNITSAWSYANVTFNKTIRNFGTKLSLSNNGIKIGKGVNHVRVTGSAMLNGIANGDMYIALKHNSSVLAESYYRPSNSTYYGTITLPNQIISVTEGDMIYMSYGAGATGSLKIAGSNYTTFTVEVID